MFKSKVCGGVICEEIMPRVETKAVIRAKQILDRE